MNEQLCYLYIISPALSYSFPRIEMKHDALLFNVLTWLSRSGEWTKIACSRHDITE